MKSGFETNTPPPQHHPPHHLAAVCFGSSCLTSVSSSRREVTAHPTRLAVGTVMRLDAPWRLPDCRFSPLLGGVCDGCPSPSLAALHSL